MAGQAGTMPPGTKCDEGPTEDMPQKPKWLLHMTVMEVTMTLGTVAWEDSSKGI